MAGPSELAGAYSYCRCLLPGRHVREDERTSFPSAHPVDLRLGHVKGVTKPEQAERANGVHTEVSVGRQGPPPAGGPVFHGRLTRVGVHSSFG